MRYVKFGIGMATVLALSGCLTLGTRIGVGSGGVSGGVVLSGAQDVGNGVTVGASVGKGL